MNKEEGTSMKPVHVVIGVVAALALAGGGFAAGMTVGRGAATDATTSASPSGAAGRVAGAIGQRLGQGGALGAAGAAGGQAVSGRILSVNDGSITVEVRQAGTAGASPTLTSQIVLVGRATRLVKTAETEIKLTDLKANDQVTIVGTTDASGNVSATMIVAGNAFQTILGGQGRTAPGGPAASPSPSARR
jgi:hypothetical protein